MIFLIYLSNGCAETKYIYRTDVEYVVVKPSSALLEECKQITSKEIKTNGDLVIAYNDLMFEYLICSNKIKTLKQFYSSYKTEPNTLSDISEK